MFRSTPAIAPLVRTLLPLLVLATGCNPGPQSAAGFERVESSPRIVPILEDRVEVDAHFAHADGTPVDDAFVCSADACVPVFGGQADLKLRADEEVELRLEGPGLAQAVYAFRTPIAGPVSITLPVDHEDDLDRLASAFGVERSPNRATVIQWVLGRGVQPSLSGAEGPFFLDASREPVLGATEAKPGQAYVFFNVVPGETSIALPGCSEGSLHWGAPGDGGIDIATTPGDTLRLLPVVCPEVASL